MKKILTSVIIECYLLYSGREQSLSKRLYDGDVKPRISLPILINSSPVFSFYLFMRQILFLIILILDPNTQTLYFNSHFSTLQLTGTATLFVEPNLHSKQIYTGCDYSIQFSTEPIPFISLPSVCNIFLLCPYLTNRRTLLTPRKTCSSHWVQFWLVLSMKC